MKKKILVAEDDKYLQSAIIKKLSSPDYTLIPAKNGQEALDLFKTEQPDLILLDIVMPEKSGFEVLEEIRVKLKSTVSVIIISNLDSPQDKELAKNLGVTGYIMKSEISLTDLAIQVKNALAAKPVAA